MGVICWMLPEIRERCRRARGRFSALVSRPALADANCVFISHADELAVEQVQVLQFPSTGKSGIAHRDQRGSEDLCEKNGNGFSAEGTYFCVRTPDRRRKCRSCAVASGACQS